MNVGTLSGVAVTYSVANAGETGCAFKGESGNDALTLTYENWGLCVLTARASLAGYREWVREEYVRIRPGTIRVTPGSFAQSDTLKVGAGTKTPGALTGKSPSDADFAWQLVRGERDCTLVDSATGEVRAKAVSFEGGTPLCSLQVVARKRNYETHHSAVVSIPLEVGDMGDVTVKYGRGVSDVLPMGGHVDIASLTEAGGLNVAMTGVAAQGDGICTVDSEPNSATFGRVSAVEGAALGDTCQVTVAASAVGYADSEGTVDLIVSGELDLSAIAPVLVYDGSLQIGVATPLAPGAATDLPDDNGATPPVTITWGYLVEGRVCSVDEATGALTPETGANAGDECTVWAVATASQYEDVLVGPAVVPVVAGVLAFESESAPTYQANLNMGAGMAPQIPHNGNPVDDNDVAVSWGSWRVEGNCSVSDEGVVTAGEETAPGDVCKVFAVASAPNYEDYIPTDAIGTITVLEPAIFGTITPPTYAGDLTVRGFPVEISVEPSLTPSVEGVGWSYRAVAKRDTSVHQPTGEICSVDANSGVVTPGEKAALGDTCEIVAVPAIDGYAERAVTDAAEIRVLPVKETFASLTWANFPTEAAVGVDISLSGNQPTADPATGTTYAISVVSGDCTYSGTTLAFTDTTECVVKVVAGHDDIVSITEMFRITPVAGTIAVNNLGSYTGVKVGVTVSAPNITPAGLGTAYTTATGSTGCTVDAATGAVTGIGAGTDNCLIDVTLSKDAYNDLVRTYTISVGKGSQSTPLTNVNPYGSSPAVALDGTALGIETALASGQGDLVYSVHSSDGTKCSVDSATGAVTAKVAGVGGTCRIQAKYAGNANYRASDLATIDTVAIGQGSWGNVAWTGYSPATATVGGTSPTLQSPTSTPEADGWTYSTTAAGTVCTVNTSTGVLTLNGVGNCPVKAVPAKTGYATHNGVTATVAISKGTQSAPPTNGNPYGNSPTLAVGASALNITNALAAGEGAIQYAVHSSDTSYCTVNATSGAVEALAAGSGNDCRIQAKYIGNANYLESAVSTIATIGITAGTIVVSDWGSYTGVVVGAATNAPTITGTPATTAAYAEGQGSTGCTVTAVGAVTGSATGTGNCKVTVTLSATGYDNLEHTYAVNVGAGSFTSVTWAGYSSHTVTLVADVPTLQDPVSVPEADSWRYSTTAASSICTVNPTTGALTLVDVGSCPVTVEPVKANYAATASDQVSHTVEVVNRTITVSDWGNYEQGQVNVTTNPPTPVSTPASVNKAYSLGSGSNGCTVDATTGVVTGTGLTAQGCKIVVTLSADGYDDLEHTYSISIASGFQSPPDWTDHANPYGANPQVAVGATLSISGTTPTGGRGPLRYSVAHGHGSRCSVNANTGAVTGKVGGVGTSCTIQSHFEVVNNYAPSDPSNVASISIVAGTITVSDWGSYTGVAVENNTNAPTITSVPSDVTAAYDLADDSSGCTVTADGVLTGSAVSETCKVVVTLSKTNYNQLEHTYTVSVAGHAFDSVAWTGYSSHSLTYGDANPTLSAPTSEPVADSWSYSTSAANTVCTVDATTGALAIVGAGRCPVTVEPVKTDYVLGDDDPITHTVTIAKANQSGPVWTGHPYGVAVPDAPFGGSVPITGTKPVGQGALEYQPTYAFRGECTVDRDTGELTGGSASYIGLDCAYESRFRGNANYHASPWRQYATARLIAGTITATWGSYQSVVSGESIDAPTITSTPADVTATYALGSGSSGCTVDFSAGAVTGVSASNGCKIKVTLSKTGYNNLEHTYTISVGLGSQSAPDWTDNPNPYGASPEVAVGATLAISGTAPTGESLLGYTVASGDTSYCSVDATTGAVTGKPAGPGNSCTIESHFVLDGSYRASSSVTVASIAVVTGTMGVSDWGSYTGVAVGADTDAPTITGAPAGVSAAYSEGSGSSGCSVTSAGVVTGSAVSNSCKVDVILTATGYNNLEHTYTVSVGRGSQNAPAWTGNPYGSANPDLVVGSTLALTGTSPTGEGALSYRVADGHEIRCSVHATSGLVTAKAAGITLTCTIESQFVGNTNYSASPWSEVDTIDVLGTITVSAWGSYDAIRVEDTVNAPSYTATLAGLSAAYAEASGSTGCTVTAVGAVTGTGAGSDNCLVELTLSKSGYRDATHTYVISVLRASQTDPATDANPYGASPTLAVGETRSISNALASGRGALIYSIHTDDTAYCSVNSSGTVTPKPAGAGNDCRVRAKYAGNANYLSSAVVTIATIAIEVGSFSASTWTGYSSGSTTTVGATSTLQNPTSTPAADSWSYATTAANTVCTLNPATGALTTVGVGTCTVTATPVKAGYDGTGHAVSVTLTINKGTPSAPVWTGNPYGASPEVGVGATLNISGTAPGGSYGDLEYQINSAHSTYCSVDASTGAVTGKPAGAGNSCTVESRTAGNTNYLPSPWGTVTTVSVVNGTITANWGSYDRVLFGGDTNPPSITTTPTAAAASATYSEGDSSGGCTVTSAGVVTGTTAGGDCRVDVTLSATGYDDLSHTYTFTVGQSVVSGISWSPSQSSGQVGVALTLDAVTTGVENGDTVTYSVSSGDCSFADDTAPDLTFTNTADCVVTASVARSGYSDWISDPLTISVSAGTLTGISWSPSQSTGQVGVALTLDAMTTTVSSDTITYAVAGGDCSFASNTVPTVTFTDTTNCLVTASVIRSGYNTWTSASHTITVTPASFTSASWSGYSSATATVGEAAPTPTDPSSTPEADSWSYSTTAANICTVHSTTGALTIVRVGSCPVTATPVKTGYDGSSQAVTVTITIEKGTQSAPRWQRNRFGTNPLRVGGSELSLFTAFFPRGQGSLQFRIASGDESYCRVRISGGHLRLEAKPAGAGHTCTVESRFSGNGNYLPSEWIFMDTVNIVEGSWNSVTWTGYSSDTAFAGGYDPVVPALNAPSSSPAADSWSYTTTAEDTVCEVDAGTGALTINGAGSCPVRATPVKLGYAEHSGIERTVTITAATAWTDVAWTGYSSSTASIGSTLNPNDPTSTPAADSWEYSTTADAAICTVEAGTGAMTFHGLGNCPVTAIPIKTGYAIHAGVTHTISVVQSAPTWAGHPYGALRPGLAVGSAAREPVGTAPAGQGALEYRIDSAHSTHCSVDTAGAVTAEVAGAGRDCTVEARFAGNTNFVPSVWSPITTFNILPGPLAGITWTPGHSTGKLGTPLALDAVSGVQEGDTVTYRAVSENCHFGDPEDATLKRTLHFTSRANCVVKAIVTRDGYAWESAEHTLTVGKGAQSPPPNGRNPYGANPTLTLTGTRQLAIVNPLPASHGALKYTIHSNDRGSKCNINQATGVVTGIVSAAGSSCLVQAWYLGTTDYNISGRSSIARVNLVKGTLEPIWGSYRHILVGEDRGSPEIGNIPTGVTVTKTYSLGSGSSGCTVNSSTGTARGTTAGGDCQIDVTLSATGYHDAQHSYPAVRVSTSVVPSILIWWEEHMPATEGVVGGTVTLPRFTNAPSTDTVTFSVLSGHCSIGTGESYNQVTLTGVGFCVVNGQVSRSGYDGSWISQYHTITVTEGAISGVTWTPSQSTGTVGTPLVLDAVVGNEDTDTVTYSVVSGECSLGSGDATAARTLSFTGRADCVVKARVGRPGYGWDSGNHTITVSKGAQSNPPTDGNPYGLVPTVAVGAPLIIQNPLPASAGTPEYRIHTSNRHKCSIHAGTGTVTAKAAGVGENCPAQAQYRSTTNHNASGWVTLQNIRIVHGTISGVTWTPTQSTGTVGTDLVLDAVSGEEDTDTVTYSVIRGDCSLGAGRTLSFTAAGACVVMAGVDRDGYISWTSSEHTVTASAP